MGQESSDTDSPIDLFNEFEFWLSGSNTESCITAYLESFTFSDCNASNTYIIQVAVTRYAESNMQSCVIKVDI